MARDKTNPKGVTILLTGGAGFLGVSIIQELLDTASPIPVKELKVVDLKPLTSQFDGRIHYVQGDIRDRDLMFAQCKGVDLVIHSAAIVDWGTKSEEEVMSVNFAGTRNIVEACLENQVKALVFTSSLDVLFSGQPLVNVNEDTPYPDRHSTSYCESKYQAEKLVIKANNDRLKTCSIRPSDIYGEGDPYHIGSLINMAKGGFYVRLGDGASKCQHVYVGNVAYAHVLAAHALLNGSDRVAGQAYFITDGPGTNFFTFFDRIVEGAGYRIWPKNLWLPCWLAYGIGSISEFVAYLVRPLKKYNPKMSRFAVTYTCTSYTFNSDKARNEFSFIPKYSTAEAYERTIEYFKK